METNHLENSNGKKVDKVRRKLLIGAATTPLIMTLCASKVMGQGIPNIRGLMENPSKAAHDGVGYSGLLNNSGGGTEQSEMSLYVFLIMESTRFPLDKMASSTYINMVETHDAKVIADADAAKSTTDMDVSFDLMLQCLAANNYSGWGDTLLPPANAAWKHANDRYAYLKSNPSGNEEVGEEVQLNGLDEFDEVMENFNRDLGL